MSGSAAPMSEKPGKHRVELGLLAAGLYGLVGFVAMWVRGGTAPLRVDRVVSHLVGSARVGRVVSHAGARAPWLGGLGRQLVIVGLPLTGVAIAGGLAFAAWRRRDLRAAALCLFGPALAVVLTDDVLKPIVDRHSGAALAYPSGHATGAAAVAALVLVLFHRWRGWKATAWFAPVALALPAVMGLCLVRFGFHYPTDVVGGTAVGIATIVAVAVLLDAQRAQAPAGGTPR